MKNFKMLLKISVQQVKPMKKRKRKENFKIKMFKLLNKNQKKLKRKLDIIKE